MNDRVWRAGCLALLGLALIAGLPRLGDLPLDSHEIFVAGTAQEMARRADLILPWFNGTPRLNKPPLSYWAAMLAAGITGDLPRVDAIHIRSVSLLGGLLMLWSVVGISARLFDRQTALLAGGLLVGSAGFFTFVHDGRPDMLYAGLTSMMLHAGVARGHAGSRPAPIAWWGLWSAAAAAILTKGPQLPLMGLLGLALALRASLGSWARVNARLRPLPGLGWVAVLCLPWWTALNLRLPELAVAQSQLGGSLLKPDAGHLLELYYLYHPLQMLLPWFIPILLAPIVWWLNPEARRGLRLLALPVCVAAVLLSFGRQYRYFYLLPMLAPMVVLLARPLALSCTDRSPKGRFLVPALLLQGLVLAGCILWILTRDADRAAAAVGAICIGLLSAVMAWWTIRRGSAAFLASLLVLMPFLWAGAAYSGRLWNEERFAAHSLATRAADVLPPTTPLVALTTSPTLYAYYTAREVPMFPDMTALEIWRSAHRVVEFGLVTDAAQAGQLQEHYEVLLLGDYQRGAQREGLYRVRRR